MTVYSTLAVSSALPVNPSLTELDIFVPGSTDYVWISIENTDVSQTLQGKVQMRAGTSGIWVDALIDDFADMVAGETRIRRVQVQGAGQVRVTGTASGAGLTVNYARRNVVDQ